jgi:hypothetical protein
MCLSRNWLEWRKGEGLESGWMALYSNQMRITSRAAGSSQRTGHHEATTRFHDSLTLSEGLFWTICLLALNISGLSRNLAPPRGLLGKGSVSENKTEFRDERGVEVDRLAAFEASFTALLTCEGQSLEKWRSVAMICCSSLGGPKNPMCCYVAW